MRDVTALLCGSQTLEIQHSHDMRSNAIKYKAVYAAVLCAQIHDIAAGYCTLL